MWLRNLALVSQRPPPSERREEALPPLGCRAPWPPSRQSAAPLANALPKAKHATVLKPPLSCNGALAPPQTAACPWRSGSLLQLLGIAAFPTARRRSHRRVCADRIVGLSWRRPAPHSVPACVSGPRPAPTNLARRSLRPKTANLQPWLPSVEALLSERCQHASQCASLLERAGAGAVTPGLVFDNLLPENSSSGIQDSATGNKAQRKCSAELVRTA